MQLHFINGYCRRPLQYSILSIYPIFKHAHPAHILRKAALNNVRRTLVSRVDGLSECLLEMETLQHDSTKLALCCLDIWALTAPHNNITATCRGKARSWSSLPTSPNRNKLAQIRVHPDLRGRYVHGKGVLDTFCYGLNVKNGGRDPTWIFLLKKKKKTTPWPKSASELYRPSDHRLSAKLVPTFAGRGCCVVSATNSHGR
jgi:hypothetical protein